MSEMRSENPASTPPHQAAAAGQGIRFVLTVGFFYNAPASPEVSNQEQEGKHNPKRLGVSDDK